MANRTIAVVVSDEDHDFLAELAGSHWSYVATIARRLLAEKISEVRSEMITTAVQDEESENAR